MAKRMGIGERERIKFLLGCGMKVAQVAEEIGRPDSTRLRRYLPEIRYRHLLSATHYSTTLKPTDS